MRKWCPEGWPRGIVDMDAESSSKVGWRHEISNHRLMCRNAERGNESISIVLIEDWSHEHQKVPEGGCAARKRYVRLCAEQGRQEGERVRVNLSLYSWIPANSQRLPSQYFE